MQKQRHEKRGVWGACVSPYFRCKHVVTVALGDLVAKLLEEVFEDLVVVVGAAPLGPRRCSEEKVRHRET